MYCKDTTGQAARSRLAAVVILFLLFASTLATAQQVVGQTTIDKPNSFTMPDELDWTKKATLAAKLQCIDGNSIELLSPNRIGSVVVFISTDCPIGNSYQPLLEQFRSQWAPQKLQLVMVHGHPEVTMEQAVQHAKEYRIRWPIALDPQQELAKRLQAKNIPEAFVLDRQGDVLYRGRIDDQYSALGRKRPEPTTNDLKDAVDCLLNGQPIANRETKAVGCVIRYANR